MFSAISRKASKQMINSLLPRPVSPVAAKRLASSRSLTDSDMEKLEKTFTKADRNLDYFLDMWEFNNFTRLYLGRTLDYRDLRMLFEELDNDCDSQLRKEDVLHHFEKRFGPMSDGMIESAFCAYDKDDDGYMKLHEFRQALYHLGLPALPPDLRDIFEKYDTDHDLHITYPQFNEIVRKEMPAFFGK